MTRHCHLHNRRGALNVVSTSHCRSCWPTIQFGCGDVDKNSWQDHSNWRVSLKTVDYLRLGCKCAGDLNCENKCTSWLCQTVWRFGHWCTGLNIECGCYECICTLIFKVLWFEKLRNPAVRLDLWTTLARTSWGFVEQSRRPSRQHKYGHIGQSLHMISEAGKSPVFSSESAALNNCKYGYISLAKSTTE